MVLTHSDGPGVPSYSGLPSWEGEAGAGTGSEAQSFGSRKGGPGRRRGSQRQGVGLHVSSHEKSRTGGFSLTGGSGGESAGARALRTFGPRPALPEGSGWSASADPTLRVKSLISGP